VKIKRKELLSALGMVEPGLSSKLILEQSDCFVFHRGLVVTFNDEIMASARCDIGCDAVVGSADFRKVVSKFPDDELDIVQRKGELVVKGDRRSAGHLCSAEIHLPIDAVPAPPKKSWSPIGEGIADILRQAADACGSDESQNLSTMVSVTPGRIEACDNYRLFRYDGDHGFQNPVLIPAASVRAISGRGLSTVAMGEGWVYFKTDAGAVYSVRCSHEPYHEGMDKLLELDGGERVRMPAELGGIIDRALVMNESGFDSNITVGLSDGELMIHARKDAGWFRERRTIKYQGRSLTFAINPRFFIEVLERTHTVYVTDQKMKITVGPIQFVLSLPVINTEEEGA